MGRKRVLENIDVESPFWQEKVQNRIFEALQKGQCYWEESEHSSGMEGISGSS